MVSIRPPEKSTSALNSVLISLVLLMGSGIGGFVAYNVVEMRADVSGMQQHIASLDFEVMRINRTLFPKEFGP